jgi:hypothetical protein
MDKKRNADIRTDLKIFSLGEKAKEYQQRTTSNVLKNANLLNSLEVVCYHPKRRRERGRPPKRW